MLGIAIVTFCSLDGFEFSSDASEEPGPDCAPTTPNEDSVECKLATASSSDPTLDDQRSFAKSLRYNTPFAMFTELKLKMFEYEQSVFVREVLYRKRG